MQQALDTGAATGANPFDAGAAVEQLDKQRRKVDFDTYDITVQQLLSMVSDKSIDIAPDYQRQFRWDNDRRSRLVESVFLGVPVPSLFMATNRDGTWEVIDGVQRISTLVQFAGEDDVRSRLSLSTPLVLGGLEKLTEINGRRFTELPATMRLQFNRRPVKVIALSDKSDLVVRFDLFERLNTGGVLLTDQEIRACVFRGDFNNFLERLAKEGDFRRVVRLTSRKQGDRTIEECVLRFFAFLDHYKDFKHSVVEFLNSYMESSGRGFDYSHQEARFKQTFRELARALPNGIVRSETRNITPINLFEGIAVGAALALERRTSLIARGIEKWIQSEELTKLTTGPTNNRFAVRARIEYCRDRFLGL
jgi:hypothetical protein